MGIVHFSEMFFIARYSSLKAASSDGNDPLVLSTFRSDSYEDVLKDEDYLSARGNPVVRTQASSIAR